MNAPHERLIALWLGVIAQSLRDVIHPELDKPTPEDREVAYEWLTSDSTDQYSYLWVCDVTGLEPDEARRRLREVGML